QVALAVGCGERVRTRKPCHAVSSLSVIADGNCNLEEILDVSGEDGQEWNLDCCTTCNCLCFIACLTLFCVCVCCVLCVVLCLWVAWCSGCCFVCVVRGDCLCVCVCVCVCGVCLCVGTV